MTAQEKAKELVDKFYLVNSESVELETGEHDLVLSLDARDAKQCALIAVDEILDAIDWHEFETPNLQMWFWEAVKKEIELL